MVGETPPNLPIRRPDPIPLPRDEALPQTKPRPLATAGVPFSARSYPKDRHRAWRRGMMRLRLPGHWSEMFTSRWSVTLDPIPLTPYPAPSPSIPPLLEARRGAAWRGQISRG